MRLAEKSGDILSREMETISWLKFSKDIYRRACDPHRRKLSEELSTKNELVNSSRIKLPRCLDKHAKKSGWEKFPARDNREERRDESSIFEMDLG